MLLDDYMRSYGIKKRNNCVHFDDCMPDELKKYIRDMEALNCRLERYLITIQ